MSIEIRLTDAAEAATRLLADQFDLDPPEVVRRGLSLFQLWASLAVNESLGVINNDNGKTERVILSWLPGAEAAS